MCEGNPREIDFVSSLNSAWFWVGSESTAVSFFRNDNDYFFFLFAFS